MSQTATPPSAIERAVASELAQIPDPEMPISIVELGLLHEIRVRRADPTDVNPESSDHVVEIDLLPTFVGCPALDMIRSEVTRRIGALPGVARVHVQFRFDPPWSIDRISPAGLERLRQFGVTAPPRNDPRASGGCSGGVAAPGAPELLDLTVPSASCPFCGASQTRRTSRFGPTRCKMIYYCDACKNTFEQLRPL